MPIDGLGADRVMEGDDERNEGDDVDPPDRVAPLPPEDRNDEDTEGDDTLGLPRNAGELPLPAYEGDLWCSTSGGDDMELREASLIRGITGTAAEGGAYARSLRSAGSRVGPACVRSVGASEGATGPVPPTRRGPSARGDFPVTDSSGRTAADGGRAPSTTADLG